MEVQLNTLYVMTRRAVIRRNHLTLQVLVEGKTKLTVPIHQIESVAAFGGVHVTPSAMALCAEHGAAVAFLSESGRLVCRVDAPSGGNVLLRREQYRQADRPEIRALIARNMVAGKIQNARNLLLRSARESDDEDDGSRLVSCAKRLAEDLPPLEIATDVDSIRGLEGDSAKEYFGVFSHMVKRHREAFRLNGRNRRPPLDPMNALLSFLYGLLTHYCTAACAAAGLDPSVGFLHADRPGRPGLALDLMEEFRSGCDRLALALINRQQVKPDGFEKQESGAVWMNEATRRTVLSEWQKRKREVIVHPYLEAQIPIGRLPFIQARILARCLRGDLSAYVPCVPKN